MWKQAQMFPFVYHWVLSLSWIRCLPIHVLQSPEDSLKDPEMFMKIVQMMQGIVIELFKGVF